MTASSGRFPVLFLSHGGGPCFFMDGGNDSFFKSIDRNSDATKWYKQLASQVKLTEQYNRKPKAIVIISAHWETRNTFRVTDKNVYDELFYDYYGFPPHTYELKYPAPGDKQLTAHVIDLVRKAGIEIEADSQRNFDHGVFVPLLLIYPKADVPIVQISVNACLDPALHVNLGRAIASLRDEGVLIIGSGQTTHGHFTAKQNVNAFLNGLVDTLVNKTGEQRVADLINWEKAIPFSREAHGKEEHLIPLHVCAGAALNDRAKLLNEHMAGDMALHSFIFE